MNEEISKDIITLPYGTDVVKQGKFSKLQGEYTAVLPDGSRQFFDEKPEIETLNDALSRRNNEAQASLELKNELAREAIGLDKNSEEL